MPFSLGPFFCSDAVLQNLSLHWQRVSRQTVRSPDKDWNNLKWSLVTRFPEDTHAAFFFSHFAHFPTKLYRDHLPPCFLINHRSISASVLCVTKYDGFLSPKGRSHCFQLVVLLAPVCVQLLFHYALVVALVVSCAAQSKNIMGCGRSHQSLRRACVRFILFFRVTECCRNGSNRVPGQSNDGFAAEVEKLPDRFQSAESSKRYAQQKTRRSQRRARKVRHGLG